jgi:PAS domain S-box-containing protein
MKNEKLAQDHLLEQDVSGQKRAEEVLKTSEDKYRRIFENIQDVYYEVTLDGVVLEVSPSIEQVAGYKREEIIGKSLSDVYADPKKRDEFIKELLTNGTVTDYEVLLKDKSGNQGYCSITARLASDKHGNPQKIIGSLRNITERKNAEEALKESEKRYRTLVECARDIIYTISEDGKIASLNPAFETITDWSSSDWIGKDLVSIVHPDDWPLALEMGKHALRGDKPPTHEVRVLSKSGEYKTAEFTIAPLIEKTSVVGILGVGRDITDRKQAEAALRESEAQKRAILDASIDRIRHVDKEMKTIWINKAAASGFDRSPEDVVGEVCYKILLGRDTPCEGCPTVKALATGQIERAVVYHPKVKGFEGRSYWDNYCVPLKNEAGEIVSLVQVSRNITEQKQAEEALRESEERFKSIFENAPIGFYRTTPDGRILDANPRLVEMLGYATIEELASVNLEKHEYHPEYPRHLFRERIERDGEIRGMESFWKRPDNTLVFIRENARVIRDAKGSVLYYEGTVEDITDQKRAEEHIHALTQELIKAQETERQRISQYLHDDVAQDLSTLKIGLETLFEDQPAVSNETKQRVSELSKILQRAITAVRDLAYDQRPPSLDELGLVQAVFQYCENFSEKTRVGVDFYSAGMDDLRLDFDTEINLYRLIQESLNNIKKHAEARHVTVRLVASFPHIILRIEDDGKGFDVEGRLLRALDEKRMGLRSMEERVSLLKGKLKIQSCLGEGTKMLVEVPFKEKRIGSK